MALSKEDVKKIATLARLELSEDELEKFSGQLSGILDYMESLNEVDTEGVEPISQVTGLENITFEDEVASCDYNEELIKQTPQDVQDNMIKVKSVF